jgi:glutathione synthase
MSTQKSVAIQMDPIETVDINGDSSFVLALEAEKRGYSLYHYRPSDLNFRDGRVWAHARSLSVRRVQGDHYTLGERGILDLRDVDVVLMRQDPPFDMGYITATHILEHIHPDTLVVNDPAHVRNAPEKLLVTQFPDFMPPTLITGSKSDVEDFRKEFKDIIIKPLFGNGGAGVFRLQEGDENLASLLEMFAIGFPREPFMVQQYLPAVRQGDKRVILIDGQAAGAINRVPAAGETRSNMHVGGRPVKDQLTKRDLEICEAIGPMLRERGLIFVGIDVIGGYLTEINVTSPTGLQEVNRFDNTCLEAQIWDAIERRL